MVHEQWEIKCEHRVREAEHKKQVEIDRLTVIINLYKEKLTRKESENRNLLVELKVTKEKIEVIRQDYQEQIRVLKIEIKNLENEIASLRG